MSTLILPREELQSKVRELTQSSLDCIFEGDIQKDARDWIKPYLNTLAETVNPCVKEWGKRYLTAISHRAKQVHELAKKALHETIEYHDSLSTTLNDLFELDRDLILAGDFRKLQFKNFGTKIRRFKEKVSEVRYIFDDQLTPVGRKLADNRHRLIAAWEKKYLRTVADPRLSFAEGQPVYVEKLPDHMWVEIENMKRIMDDGQYPEVAKQIDLINIGFELGLLSAEEINVMRGYLNAHRKYEDIWNFIIPYINDFEDFLQEGKVINVIGRLENLDTDLYSLSAPQGLHLWYVSVIKDLYESKQVSEEHRLSQAEFCYKSPTELEAEYKRYAGSALSYSKDQWIASTIEGSIRSAFAYRLEFIPTQKVCSPEESVLDIMVITIPGFDITCSIGEKPDSIPIFS